MKDTIAAINLKSLYQNVSGPFRKYADNTKEFYENIINGGENEIN